jgi:5-(carboxyamino)imidazole ribonucleotide synthase
VILPGATLGLLGGGQLGRMFTIRARTMGYRVVVLDPDPVSPAGSVADRHLCSPYLDPTALTELGEEAAVVTTEFENVPAEALRQLARHCEVWPPVAAVMTTQDRGSEKAFLAASGIATAPFTPVASPDEAASAWEVIGPPAILKTARLGYDGKGQAVVESRAQVLAAFDRFGQVPCVLERKLDLTRELSVVLARGTDGGVAVYPVGENVHVDGILDTTMVPARVSGTLAAAATGLAVRVAEHLDYVGVLGVEMFVTEGDQLWVNEIAPRPHNTGHYTLDACVTDQFEQQVRAVCGLPLGQPDLMRPVAMANLLGDLWIGGPPAWDRALAVPGVTLHLYGKREPRPGRKMGHLNCVADTPELALERVVEARSALIATAPGDH